MTESVNAPVKAYVYGDPNERAKSFHFTEMLRRHQIDVYALNGSLKLNNLSNSPASFDKGSAVYCSGKSTSIPFDQGNI
jgi:hypothetical protein